MAGRDDQGGGEEERREELGLGTGGHCGWDWESGLLFPLERKKVGFPRAAILFVFGL